MLPKARWANTGRICRSYYKKMQFLILFNQKSPLKFIENASNNKKFTINRMHLSHYLVILAQANCRERSVNSQYSWEYCWPRIVSPSCSASQPKLVHDASHFFDQSELDMYFFNFMTSSFFKEIVQDLKCDYEWNIWRGQEKTHLKASLW